MDVICKRCGTCIPARDVNLDRMVAKCVSCDAVFAFEDQLGPSPVSALVPVAPSAPEGWVVVEEDLAAVAGPSYRHAAAGALRPLTIRWRWFKPVHLFSLFFSLVWNAFLVFWYAAAGAGGAPWIFYVFPLLHVAVGIGMFYSSMAGLLNSTELRLADGRLSMAHGPLPWRGARSLEVGEVAGVEAWEDRSGERHALGTHSLRVQRRGGDEIVLVKNLPGAREARFLEERLRQALQLSAAPAAEALPSPRAAASSVVVHRLSDEATDF